MLKIAIVDDEEILCQQMKESINRYFFSKNLEYRISTYNSGDLFLTDIEKKYDVVLLDIDMPESNGLEIAEKLREYQDDAVIIFVTSKIKYMQEAFGINVFAFVKKDDMDTLNDVLDRCMICIQTNKSILVKSKQGFIKLREASILFIEYEGRKVIINTKDGKYEANGETLSSIEKRLNNKIFIYVNRGVIINLKYLESTKNHIAKLKGVNYEIPISNDKYKNVNLALMDYISRLRILK